MRDISGITKELVILTRQKKCRIVLRGHTADYSQFIAEKIWAFDEKLMPCPNDSFFTIIECTIDQNGRCFDLAKNERCTFRIPTKNITY